MSSPRCLEIYGQHGDKSGRLRITVPTTGQRQWIFYKKNPTQFDQDQFGKDKALQRGDVYIVEPEEVWTGLVPCPLGILRLYRP